MFFQLIIAILVGVSAGIFTGLAPGIHINLISLLVVSASPFLLRYTSPIVLVVLIISMAVTHTFLDFIPSIFIGAPEADTALAVLPGHKLLLKGEAYQAVQLTVLGSLGALIISVALFPLLIPTVSFIYPILKQYIVWILIAAMCFMILKDKNRLWNFVVFFMSGILGLIVLNMPLKDPLFPMLSGLFGLGMLIKSLSENINIPEQRITKEIDIEKPILLKALFSGTFAGFLTSFFPGLGPAQGAVIASQVTRKLGNNGFMILLGGINTTNMVLSLVTLYTLEKARSGAVVAIMKIIEQISFNYLIIVIFCILIVGGIATILALKITKIFAKLIKKVNYKAMVITVILTITTLVFVFCGWLGLLVLLVSTCVGMIPIELGIAKSHSMGCLIFPVILYFL